MSGLDKELSPSIETVPEDLDEMEPGLFLAAILSGVDAEGLSGYDRILVLRAYQKMVSHFQARLYGVMVAVADWISGLEVGDAEDAFDLASAEIRAALCMTRRPSESELAFAEHLRTRLPRVWEALASGVIDLRRAKTIVYGTGHLSVENARKVVDQIIAEASELTSGQLYHRLRKLCIQADPGEAEKRYEKTVEDRRIISEATDDGTAHLMGLDLPPHRVAAVSRRINRIAQSLKTRDEKRSIDQLRADVFLDLLCGTRREEGSSQGMVDIRVDLPTLAELNDNPGDLSGYGPVIADIARQVAAEQVRAEWRYTVTDPETGRMVTGTTQRRPTAQQRRIVESRDPTCVAPGCRMPARECDLDHRILWSECRTTHEDKLHPLCRHDHGIRHKGWKVNRLPDGSYQWTTLLGHTYITKREPP